MTFLVRLDAFHGPLDLLLYLVKKQELELATLSLARVAEQYLEYVEILEKIDADAVGEFLEIASTLLEIKSRAALPSETEEEALPEEPKQELVERLLEFKQFRDQAEQLEQRGAEWRQRSPRLAEQVSRADVDPSEQPLVGVELWDLVSAFARVMQQRLATEPEPETIVYDDTPVHVHMREIYTKMISADQPIGLPNLFPEGPVHKSTLVGVFLAILELVRYGYAMASQEHRFGEIMLERGTIELPANYGETLAA